MTTIRRRILLVENDPDLLRAVARRLRIAGYMVAEAATIAVAESLLREAIIHLAIVDIRLTDDRSETDRSGFAFARTLPPHIPVLFHTAHDTKEHIREALGQIGADDIIAKEDSDGPAKLLARVNAIFAERVGINFNLVLTSEIPLDQLAARIEVPTARPTMVDVLEATVTSADHTGGIEQRNDKAGESGEINPMQRPSGDDIDQLIRRLRPEAQTIALAPLLNSELQRSYSNSGAVLLRIHETRADGSPVPVVLKLGAQTTIRDEAERYRRIQPFLGGQRLARLEGEAYSRAIGGLLYTLVGAQAWQSIDALAVHTQQGELPRLQPMISHFLAQTFGAIQEQARPEKLDLAAHYTSELGLTVKKLCTSLQEWQPEAFATEKLRLDGETATIPNPLPWAVRNGEFYRRGAVDSYTVLCHGDLHCRNILVDDEDNCWLIDFGRAGRSHLLRDFVELEVDLRLQFMPGAPRALLYDVEAQLMADGFAPADAPAVWPNAIQRAYHLVGTVRRSAALLTAGKGAESEYQQALFWYLLNAARLRALSLEKKRYALRAAGLLTSIL